MCLHRWPYHSALNLKLELEIEVEDEVEDEVEAGLGNRAGDNTWS